MKSLITAATTGVFLLINTPVYAGALTTPQNLTLQQIECGEVGKNNAYATFSWDPVESATSYRFYSKIADGQDTYRTYNEVIETASHKFSFNPEFEFHVTVTAVNTFTGNPPSTTESGKSAEFLLTAKKLLTLCFQKPSSVNTSINSPAQASPSIGANESQAKIQELENKIKSLENQVMETQKRQSKLEHLVNSLFAYIKKVLPF